MKKPKQEKPLFLMSREQIKKKYGKNVFKNIEKGKAKAVLRRVLKA